MEHWRYQYSPWEPAHVSCCLVQYYDEPGNEQWPAQENVRAISDWAKLIVTIRFLQKKKQLNQMLQVLQEGKSKVGPDRVYAYPSDVVDDKLQIVDDSELLVSYPKIQLLTFCGPFRFSASMVLNYLRDVLVFNASKACGYPDRKKFRDRLNGIISSLPVEHVLKESVKQYLMVEEAKFLNSYSKLTEHFPQRSEAYVKRWKSRRSGQKQPKKPMKNPKNGELSPYSQTNLNRNAC